VKKLNASQIKSALVKITDWKKKGAIISRTFQFKDFPAAMKFVNAVAEIAEEEWHHPDIDIRWNKVTLALTTHDAGGLTKKDFALAKKFGAQFGIRGQLQRRASRNRRANDGAVGIAIDELHLAGGEKRLDQEVGPKPVGAELRVIVLIGRKADLHDLVR